MNTFPQGNNGNENVKYEIVNIDFAQRLLQSEKGYLLKINSDAVNYTVGEIHKKLFEFQKS